MKVASVKSASCALGLALGISFWGAAAAQGPLNADGLYNETPVVLHAGTLLAVPGEAPRGPRSVVVIDGRIADIHDGMVSPDEAGVSGARTVNLADYFVLPGLIDGHVHTTSSLDNESFIRNVTLSDADRAVWGARNARATLLAGFTTVRDTAAFRGNSFNAVFALRDGIREGKLPGPRMLVAGQGIGATGGHGDFLRFRYDILDMLASRAMCSGAYECREAVRYQIKRGADFIKIAATGGATSGQTGGMGQHLFDDELKAIVDTAHMFGRRVTAHATSAGGINAALRAGVDSIEHGSDLDEESLELFLETGAYLQPTLMVTRGLSSYAEGGEEAPLLVAARRAHNAGVKLSFGTDSSITPHGANAGEFELLVSVGLSPMQAIETATVNAAANLGLADQIGTIETGKAADIIAVASSPLDDITELQRVRFVMRNGVIYRLD